MALSDAGLRGVAWSWRPAPTAGASVPVNSNSVVYPLPLPEPLTSSPGKITKTGVSKAVAPNAGTSTFSKTMTGEKKKKKKNMKKQ